MLKYESTLITFTEVPDEISLCINLTCCPCKCHGCFEPWLRKDYGTIVTEEILTALIQKHPHITCVCFMGGDNDYHAVHDFCAFIKEKFHLKTAVYSGLEKWNPLLVEELDYYKLGPYNPKYGPLNSPTTNQKMWQYEDDRWIDITYKFQRQKG